MVHTDSPGSERAGVGFRKGIHFRNAALEMFEMSTMDRTTSRDFDVHTVIHLRTDRPTFIYLGLLIQDK